jgi:hypothetical protein
LDIVGWIYFACEVYAIREKPPLDGSNRRFVERRVRAAPISATMPAG